MKLVVEEPSGSIQRSTRHVRDWTGCDYTYEQSLDYQQDGIHLAQTKRDTRHAVGAPVVENDCGMGVVRTGGSVEICNPIPAPLILPTDARAGQSLRFAMVCATLDGPAIHQVDIDFVGNRTVVIAGRRSKALVVHTHDAVTGVESDHMIDVRSWVTPVDGLVVWETGKDIWKAKDSLVYEIRTNWTASLVACANCPRPTGY